MSDPRTLATLVLARSNTATTFLTYRGLITERPVKNYVSLLFGAGAVSSSCMAGTTDLLTWTFRATCVGYTEDEVLFVAAMFRALFVNWRPLSAVSAGWFTEAQDDPPVIKDETTLNDVRYSLTLRYRITTSRST